MKITGIKIEGFQGIPYLVIAPKTPITLVAGPNGAGKSSVRDAVRFALAGESARVSLKKDYPNLVYEGSDAKKAAVTVTADGIDYSRQVASGKGSNAPPDYPAVMPQLDGTTPFTALGRTGRQQALASFIKLSGDRKRIESLLSERGIPGHMVTMALPMLRSGFEAAHKDASSRKSEAVGAWKAITGEVYGSLKADGWKATPQVANGKNQDELLEQRTILLKERDDTKAEADSLQAKIAKFNSQQGIHTTCPHCEKGVWILAGKLAADHTEADPKAVAKHTADKADLTNVTAKMRVIIDALTDVNRDIAGAQQAADDSEERTKKAAEYHQQVKDWTALADAFSPEGLPLELMKEALRPINDRLGATAASTGWPITAIRSDLEVTYDGRPYGLLSESEKWRADAALAESMSHFSGAKVLFLDRFDVLSVQNRAACLKWLMAVAPQHDSIFISGTLKEAPKGLPASHFTVVWLEKGRAVTEKAA